MLTSVFTPSHDPRFLDEAYAGLRAQTAADWEWVVLLNGRARAWAPPEEDERVRVVRVGKVAGVGAAKQIACAHARGEILLELDHDDVLASECVAEVARAFEANPGAAGVYSDFAQMNEDRSRNDERWNPSFGWAYEDEDVDGTTYLCCHAMAPHAHNFSYIWYAPNHVRAFRRSVYEAVGGYNPELTVLDDQELMMRLYLEGEFVHVPRCLYLQRMHPANTQVEPATNAFIQEETVRLYQQYCDRLASTWARRSGLRVVTLRTPTSPALVVPDADPGEVIVIDPEAPEIDVAAGSVGVLKAVDVLQRIPDRIRFFNSCHDALAPNGYLLTETPSTEGRGAFQDPTHVAFYNENSFWYVTQAYHEASVPGLRAKYQISHIRTYLPTDWHRMNDIPYVQANLLAHKEGAPRMGGPLLW